MSQRAIIVAQTAMDDFYQNYGDGVSFFLIDDFLQRVGFFAADYYRQAWKQMYDELRAERKEEIVGFDPTTLSEQFVKVKQVEGGEWVGEIEKPTLSLPFDMNTSGFQNVFNVKDGKELERSNINETWNYQYQPYNNRLFFRIDRKQIKIFTRGNSNIQEVRILYVPSIQIGDEDAELPDGIVEYVITNTVGYMRQQAQGLVVKKSLDNNPNKLIQTEANADAMKP